MNSISDTRRQLLGDWAASLYHGESVSIEPASADASFRRYFRVRHARGSHIIMDAPPQKENSEPFVQISGYLQQMGLNAPQVITQDVQQGFYLLTDLGDQPYLPNLNPQSADNLYGDALQALHILRDRGASYQALLPTYDQALLHREMHLFKDWFLQTHLGLSLSTAQTQCLQESFQCLADNALQQPQVFVHRDYHSRNLMYLTEGNPGILDFQDAVWGPVTYDLVSLLRDCYISWPDDVLQKWLKTFYARLIQSEAYSSVSEAEFVRWFDLMGVQRHLKATGIFCRLNYRDHKPGYLADIPRTMNYVTTVAAGYEELRPLMSCLRELGVLNSLAGSSA